MDEGLPDLELGRAPAGAQERAPPLTHRLAPLGGIAAMGLALLFILPSSPAPPLARAPVVLPAPARPPPVLPVLHPAPALTMPSIAPAVPLPGPAEGSVGSSLALSPPAPVPVPAFPPSPDRPLVHLQLWDNFDEDGDTVLVQSGGMSLTVVLRHRPVTIALPHDAGQPVTITGVRDGGGGGITAAVATPDGEVPLPAMTVGQTVTLPIF